jgi:hypothetical protein
MTTCNAFATVTALLTLISVGCHKPTAPPAPAAVTDFRTLTMGSIEIIIADKTGSPVTFTSAGPNKYTGTRQVPGETAQFPVTVTVEETQIVIEMRGGGLTSRQVITARGLEKDDLR